MEESRSDVTEERLKVVSSSWSTGLPPMPAGDLLRDDRLKSWVSHPKNGLETFLFVRA